MNKETVLQLNVVPEGKEAWLSYDQYQELKAIFQDINLPSSQTTIDDKSYFKLYDFLTTIAQLPVQANEYALHFNAFALIRRGYKIEEITTREYEQLSALMMEVSQADIDDMELDDFGGHRALYRFLTNTIGLSVKQGRGPVWHRAKDLLDQYERVHSRNQPA